LAERYLKNPDGLKDDIKKVFAKAEIISTKSEIVGFHSLRHSFITECVINRMEINILSKITGDNIRTLEKYYIHLKEDIIRKAEEELPDY